MLKLQWQAIEFEVIDWNLVEIRKVLEQEYVVSQMDCVRKLFFWWDLSEYQLPDRVVLREVEANSS